MGTDPLDENSYMKISSGDDFINNDLPTCGRDFDSDVDNTLPEVELSADPAYSLPDKPNNVVSPIGWDFGSSVGNGQPPIQGQIDTGYELPDSPSMSYH